MGVKGGALRWGRAPLTPALISILGGLVVGGGGRVLSIEISSPGPPHPGTSLKLLTYQPKAAQNFFRNSLKASVNDSCRKL